jgi:hypothetical protein
MARRTDLDGPALTFGGPTGTPVRQRRRVPTSTWVLLGVCLLLMLLLLASIQRGRTALQQIQTAATPTAAPSTPARAPAPGGTATPATPSASGGSDSEEGTTVPSGATSAASRFVTAWLEPEPKPRLSILKQVATPGLTEQLRDVDPAKVVDARPVGKPRPGSVSDGAATLNQRLSNGSSISIDLALDPDTRYGWLVYAVSPGARG